MWGSLINYFMRNISLSIGISPYSYSWYIFLCKIHYLRMKTNNNIEGLLLYSRRSLSLCRIATPTHEHRRRQVNVRRGINVCISENKNIMFNINLIQCLGEEQHICTWNLLSVSPGCGILMVAGARRIAKHTIY